MIPQTLGALAAFLGLVAPGIVFELLRERRRAGRKETVFREAARVALGSLGFTVVACVVMVVVNAIFGGRLFVAIDQLAADSGGYAKQHLTLIAVTVLVELVLACGLAVALDAVVAVRAKEPRTVRQVSAWRQAFVLDRPTGASSWVHVQLTDGSSFVGYLRSHTTSPGDPEERELVLEGPGLEYYSSESATPRVLSDRWPRAVIPAARIKCVWVQYRDARTDERVDARRRPVIHL